MTHRWTPLSPFAPYYECVECGACVMMEDDALPDPNAPVVWLEAVHRFSPAPEGLTCDEARVLRYVMSG